MFRLEKLIRPHLINMQPYSSARDEFKGDANVFLDANENALGSAVAENFNRYPDPYQGKVKQILAKQKQVNPEQIFLGNGSDEAIDLLIRAFCEPRQDKIVITPPTYGMYKVSADIHNVEVIKVSLTSNFQLNEDELNKAFEQAPKIVFLCSPNNPTGNLLQRDVIIRMVTGFEGVVVVDEAYIDFADERSFIQYIDKYPNLVILQTFSKAWGLAALRLGMGFADAAIINIMNKIKPPYNVNAITQLKAIEALNQVGKKEKMVHQILEEREKLIDQLSALELILTIYPTEANFILVRVDQPTVLYNYLVQKNVIVRNRSNVHLCEGCLRITVGSSKENETLINVLKEFKY